MGSNSRHKERNHAQHKEVVLFYEEGIYEVEVIRNLLIPQSSKIVLT
jgi:hypothetical protein